jgi:HD-GYP domain-containing protein (c-di-GMP phosphodiesterase class II)
VGFQSYDSIQALGVGALLHDIGKCKIDQKILMKPSELSDPEWQEIRKHPLYGEDILKKHDFIPALARRVVLEHHERVNGKGYPYGKKEIHAFSKITAIADVFNSLISERPYKKAMKPYEALKYMIVTMKEEFDSKFLGEFIEMLSK